MCFVLLTIEKESPLSFKCTCQALDGDNPTVEEQYMAEKCEEAIKLMAGVKKGAEPSGGGNYQVRTIWQ